MGLSDKADACAPGSALGTAPGSAPEEASACCPGLYPRSGMPPAAPESEKKVYAAIADALPAGWYAWHSVKIHHDEGGDTEADFIIVSPGYPDPTPGILILEVKGGAIRKQNGQWYQNGKPMPLPPRIQAIHCRAALLSKFQSRRLPCPGIGEAVVFPDQLFDAPPSQGDLEGLVIGARKLPYLKEALPALMQRAIPYYFRRRPDARPGSDSGPASTHRPSPTPGLSVRPRQNSSKARGDASGENSI